MKIADIRAAEEEARMAPTARQLEVLGWIQNFVAKHSFPPTIREIGVAFAISANAVSDHLKRLERKGFLRIDSNIARGIRLLSGPIAVPIVYGVSESVCGVLDRIERRWSDLDREAVRKDLGMGRERIGHILHRLERGE